MTSLPLANCSMFVPRRRETLGRRQWTVVWTGRPMPTSTMTAGVVDRESCDRLNGIGQVGRTKSTDALINHDDKLEGCALCLLLTQK